MRGSRHPCAEFPGLYTCCTQCEGFPPSGTGSSSGACTHLYQSRCPEAELFLRWSPSW
ncbi:unnamed protein product [Staurois parvus]|uniref:Uncharacterized protein n=1 Tax=Staurois parvus TaxID=386267 RepID=A0ABN9BH54_9NEOB|nr:unnamed protein product [Staurois parvus]